MKLRYYQEDAAKAATGYIFENPRKSAVVGLPTGSGKTLVISEIVRIILERDKKAKILIISHVMEIIEQNYNTLSSYLDIEIGLNNASIGKRECKQVTVASIQSVYKDEDFRNHKYVIVDECHLIPETGTGMYRTLLERVKNIRLIGLTATPFRLSYGFIYGPKRIFSKLVIDYTQGKKFVKLMKEGYLCNLTSKHTKLHMDTSDIPLLGGDFEQRATSKKFDKKEVTEKAIYEIIDKGKDRKKWLIFAIDIDHAEHIAESLLRKNIRTMIVHSKMEFDRNKIIKKFREGKYKAIVNVNVLTTGFDVPDIDLIATLRPTNSNVMHIQMIGRGLRIFPDKKNCLVLDFAGNTERLGPINEVKVRNKGDRRKEGLEPITKVCPDCDEIVAPAVRRCPECGFEFEFQSRLESGATNLNIVSTGEKSKKPKWVKVKQVRYKIHKKTGSPDSVCVQYFSEFFMFKEWIFPGHAGFVKYKADNWVIKRGAKPARTASELLEISQDLKKPNMIRIDSSGKYDAIIDYSF